VAVSGAKVHRFELRCKEQRWVWPVNTPDSDRTSHGRGQRYPKKRYLSNICSEAQEEEVTERCLVSPSSHGKVVASPRLRLFALEVGRVGERMLHSLRFAAEVQEAGRILLISSAAGQYLERDLFREGQLVPVVSVSAYEPDEEWSKRRRFSEDLCC
jgi:hypothetical protein